MNIETGIATYGLSAIFLGAALEGETTVIAGGILAHRHLFAPAMVAAAAATGSFLMDQLLFSAGRAFHRHPRVQTLLSRALAKRILVSFGRHPTAYVLGFRFLIGFRFVSPIVIGASGMSRERFMPLNLVAAASWASLFTAAGYWLGGRIEPLIGDLHSDRLGLVALALILAGALVAAHGHIRHLRLDKAWDRGGRTP